MSTPACTRPANERRSPLHRVLGTAFLVTLLGTGLRADGFGPQQVLSDTADAASDVVAADLDGDGDLDVLTSSEFDTTLSWFENLDGLATFGPERIISSSASEVGSVLAVDLDGDGDLDLLTAPLPAAFPPVDVLSYENVDGLGNFVQMQNVTQGSTELDGIFAADLDGDGDPDLLGTSDGDSRIAWHANQAGSGTFGPQTLIATGIIAARSPHAADVDGDGDADALAGTSYALFGPGAITLYENVDGLATFGPTQVVTTDPFSAEARRVGALEQRIGMIGIERHFHELAGSDARVPAIFDLADAGDTAARIVLDDTAKVLARAVAAICAIVDPVKVLLGGGIGGRAEIVSRVRAILPECMARPPEIEAGDLGANATIVGATAIGLGLLHNSLFGATIASTGVTLPPAEQVIARVAE